MTLKLQQAVAVPALLPVAAVMRPLLAFRHFPKFDKLVRFAFWHQVESSGRGSEVGVWLGAWRAQASKRRAGGKRERVACEFKLRDFGR